MDVDGSCDDFHSKYQKGMLPKPLGTGATYLKGKRYLWGREQTQRDHHHPCIAPKDSKVPARTKTSITFKEYVYILHTQSMYLLTYIDEKHVTFAQLADMFSTPRWFMVVLVPGTQKIAGFYWHFHLNLGAHALVRGWPPSCFCWPQKPRPFPRVGPHLPPWSSFAVHMPWWWTARTCCPSLLELWPMQHGLNLGPKKQILISHVFTWDCAWNCCGKSMMKRRVCFSSAFRLQESMSQHFKKMMHFIIFIVVLELETSEDS